MKQRLCLANLRQGQSAVVTEVRLDGAMRRRLYDLGLIPGTCVERLQAGPAGSPLACVVRGAVIALRRKDAAKIMVEAESIWD